jgi:hypothetical protein
VNLVKAAMHAQPSRLRHGEWIAGISGLLLLVFMFALRWYQPKGVSDPTAALLGFEVAPLNGWDGLTNVRWLMLLTGVFGLGLVWAQATRRAPAVPVTLSLFVMLLGGLTTLVLIYRVLINPPGGPLIEQKAGPYLALAAAIGVAYGGYASLRQEGVAPRDGPQEIETVDLSDPEASGGS